MKKKKPKISHMVFVNEIQNSEKRKMDHHFETFQKIKFEEDTQFYSNVVIHNNLIDRRTIEKSVQTNSFVSTHFTYYLTYYSVGARQPLIITIWWKIL